MDGDNEFTLAGQIESLLTARNRPLRLRLAMADGISELALLPQRVSGMQAMCDGINMQVCCLSLNARLPLKMLIGVPAQVQIVTDQGSLRSICGIVTEASQGESDGGLASYQLVIRDALTVLDLSVNTRVFLDKSELDVVKLMLGEARRDNPALAAAFEWEVDAALDLRQYPRRSQIIQCNEGNGAFLRRLLRRRGISWFFRAGRTPCPVQDNDATPGPPIHTLVLFHDGKRLNASPAGRVRFHRNSATEQRDTITAWNGTRQLRPGNVSHFSWDYNNPRGAGLMTVGVASQTDQGEKGNALTGQLDQYLVHAPHVGDNYEDLYSLARQRMARCDFEAKCFHGEGGLRDIAPGEYIGIDGHPELDEHPETERDFVILSQHITAQNNLPKELDTRIERMFARNGWDTDVGQLPLARRNWFDSGDLRFQNRFTCVRRTVPFAPAYDPRVDVPPTPMQTALVVGPAGEEVHCDDQGRIKVRLHGTRPADHVHASGAGASGTDADSAWVRVLTGWAGNVDGIYHGLLSLPRPGTEVLIAFLGGDPDKPIIVGQLYNSVTRPPLLGVGDLPGNKYLSGIKSREIHGTRANQLRLDDTPEQISAQLASDHGASELNLGWLTTPRNKGAGRPRGEGAELRTDEQLALRAGKGLLLSAWGRLGRDDKQMGRDDCLALMEDCVELFRALGKYASEHQALPLDEQAQTELQGALKRWEYGSNTAPRGADGGAAVIAVTAPDGISFATSKAIVSYAAANIDTVAQQHLQMTAGQRYNLNAGKGISLFSHHDGIAAIAHFGKFLMQSQHDDMDLNAAKTLKLTATEGKLIGMAHTIELICEDGSFIRLGDGITLGSSKPLKFNAPRFVFNDSETMATQLPVFNAGGVNARFATRYRGGMLTEAQGDQAPSSLPDAAADQKLDMSLTDGSAAQGTSDQAGKADLLQRDAMHLAMAKVLSKKKQ